MSLLFSAQRLWTLVGLLGLGKIVADSHFLISFLSILPLLASCLRLLFPQFHLLPFFSLLYSEPGITPRAGHEIHYRFSSNRGFAFGREFCGALVMCRALTWVPLTVRASSGTYVKHPRGPHVISVSQCGDPQAFRSGQNISFPHSSFKAEKRFRVQPGRCRERHRDQSGSEGHHSSRCLRMLSPAAIC